MRFFRKKRSFFTAEYAETAEIFIRHGYLWHRLTPASPHSGGRGLAGGGQIYTVFLRRDSRINKIILERLKILSRVRIKPDDGGQKAGYQVIRRTGRRISGQQDIRKTENKLRTIEDRPFYAALRRAGDGLKLRSKRRKVRCPLLPR